MTKQFSKSDIEYMLSNCEINMDDLDDWQQGFIVAIRKKFDKHVELSEKEIEKLEECYRKIP